MFPKLRVPLGSSSPHVTLPSHSTVKVSERYSQGSRPSVTAARPPALWRNEKDRPSSNDRRRRRSGGRCRAHPRSLTLRGRSYVSSSRKVDLDASSATYGRGAREVP